MNRITPKQNEYLKELATGPKTTQDLAQALNTTSTAARCMMCKLREKGLVQSHGTNSGKIHKLDRPYQELSVSILPMSLPITDTEINYVAKLRNAGLTGVNLIIAHRRKYPNRPCKSVQHVLEKARKRRLCR